MSNYSATWSSSPPKFNWNPSELDDVDPKVARWIQDSVRYGEAAGVDPRLVMAIVLNAGADANLTWGGKQGELKDWLRENTSPLREWKDGYSNSLGLTNMEEETFDKVKAEYPEVFSGREWSDLADDQSWPVEPGIDVVDIPPFGGYPQDRPAYIADRPGIFAKPGIGRIAVPEFLQGGSGLRVRNSTPWAPVVKRAEGGDVRGPGSSFGDKIPAWLSDGEFVMNARSAALNRPFLQALNADPFFLQKMLASRSESSRNNGAGPAPAAPGGQPATVNISMSNDEDIIGRLKVLAMQWELSH